MKFMRRYLGVSIIILFLSGYVFAGEIHEKIYQKKTFDGSRNREYLIFLPNSYDTGEKLPLVVVLHGCKQTHKDIMNATRFNILAEAEKLIVVYPYVTSYIGVRDTDCWGFWFDEEIHQGKGEVADIAGIINEVQANYFIDSKRIHITGLSSGGAMATAVMVAYSEIIASGAPAAGIAYGESPCSVSGICWTFSWFNPMTWFDRQAPKFKATENTVMDMVMEMKSDKRLVPLLLLHSKSDPKVDIVAAKNNAAAWAELFQVDITAPIVEKSGETDGRSWYHKCYGRHGNGYAIETHFVDGPGHAWIGGGKGTYADPDGPDWSVIAWTFFKAHPMKVYP